MAPGVTVVRPECDHARCRDAVDHAVAMRVSSLYAESLTVLSQFRADVYGCLTTRADALFELTDAVLRTDGPVRSLVEPALAPEHRRGHGSLYARVEPRPDRPGPTASDAGRPAAAKDGRRPCGPDSGRLAVAAARGTVPDRSFCHIYGRGEAKHQMMPGWPYSIVAGRGGRPATGSEPSAVTCLVGLIRDGAADPAAAQVSAVSAGGVRRSRSCVLLGFADGFDATQLAPQPVPTCGGGCFGEGYRDPFGQVVWSHFKAVPEDHRTGVVQHAPRT